MLPLLIHSIPSYFTTPPPSPPPTPLLQYRTTTSYQLHIQRHQHHQHRNHHLDHSHTILCIQMMSALHRFRTEVGIKFSDYLVICAYICMYRTYTAYYLRKVDIFYFLVDIVYYMVSRT